jgi:plastocyanin
MTYSPQPDKRLLAILIVGMIVVPSLVAIELAVPNFQPKFTPANNGEGAAVGQSSGKSSGATVLVVMPNGVAVDKSLNFLPATITLVVGVNNSVTWHNDDTTDHTVTFISVPSGVSAGAISAGDVPPGSTAGPITLIGAGTYKYHCQFHPFWMIGTIIVKAG